LKEEDIVDKVYYCLSNNVKVYPEIYKGIWLKLVADIQGKKIFGSEKYDPTRRSDQKKMQKKISELYVKLYENLTKKAK
jgi:hypothetical protein